MLEKNYNIISNCQLFSNIKHEEIKEIFNDIKPTINKYSKSASIFDDGDTCNAIGIILEGKIELSTYFISGDVSTLITLSAGNIFGEGIIFSRNDTFPISITSITNVEILYFTKDNLLEIIKKHPLFLENYLLLLSTKLLFLNDKFKLLSLNTIRGKISHVLIKLSKEQNSLKIKLPFSKEKMALHICTRRPSLSRELSKMKSEGIIDYNKSIITILDYEQLKDALF